MSLSIGRSGILVAIEGIDGAGKTTQAELVASRLERVGLEVVRTKEPTDGFWGRRLRESASKGRLAPADELAAFIADRREHVRNVIEPALASGKVVLVDRYYFSTAAYQGARGLDPNDILRTNEEFAPQPDVLVLLEVEPSVGVQRIGLRGDVSNLFEREEDLRRCAELFRQISRPYLLRIDGNASPEEICKQILVRLLEEPRFQAIVGSKQLQP